MEPVPLVELPVLPELPEVPVLPVALGSEVVEPEVLPVAEPLVEPVAEPVVLPVLLVLEGCEDELGVVVVVSVLLLRVASRLQPTKPSVEAASADRSVSFN